MPTEKAPKTPKKNTKTPSVAALKGEITRLTNRVETLEGEASTALAQRDAAQDALAEKDGHLTVALRTVDELTTALETSSNLQDVLRAQVQQLEGQLDETARKLVASEAARLAKPALAEEPLGVVRAGGLLVMAAADHIDTQWRKPQEARSQYAVDFTGPSAEFLATRITNAPRERLADGTWRLLVPDDRTAITVVGGAKSYLAKNPDGTTINSAPVKCSSMMALDATRAASCGLVTVSGQPAMFAVRGSDTMKVSVLKDDQGRFAGVKIAP